MTIPANHGAGEGVSTLRIELEFRALPTHFHEARSPGRRCSVGKARFKKKGGQSTRRSRATKASRTLTSRTEDFPLDARKRTRFV